MQEELSYKPTLLY